MQIHRDTFQGFTQSPDCQLYGKKLHTSNGKQEYFLIAPLDLVKVQHTFMMDFQIPNNKVPVLTTGGGNVGVIREFDWSLINSNGKPVVFIQPHQNFPLNKISDITRDKDSQPNVSVGESIILEFDDSRIEGTIKTAHLVQKALGDFNASVQVFQVKFDQHLHSSHHGSRVIVSSSNKLLGMLIATQNEGDGTSLANVFPAHLI
ncbi:MAG: hypothetical protein KME28_06815 [Pelatocladus maniniholoensis HA4357-MV3]|uniref:Uncharacterized protein n=1 Tax=Pelatocladus maniniholoensis HA4357-MV3 TaxID=1117104 RepID=A0A9E3H750_9NOST|nr:hypothetical protein [Pelatocladus maniniholoensis HA4357-MV3]BAZ69751.1 hypothetical protein NIES4106_45290 [Fischerella sp. NIES-4106]